MILKRYLPNVSMHGLDAWISNLANNTNLVIDPFGVSPSLLVALANMGQRVLVTVSNPINKFLIEVAASPPTKEDLASSFATLAATRRGKERLEPHILSLYESLCEQCHQIVSAKYFVWEKGDTYPLSKWISCPHCNYEGHSEVTNHDREIYDQFQNDGLHRARALESIVSKDSPMRADVEEALNIYSPRAVYALFTILNKFELLSLPKKQNRALQVIMLHALDTASNLWPHDKTTYRPIQLKTPNKYIEHNIWLSMEEALKFVPEFSVSVQITKYPDLPNKQGISIFPGPMREFSAQLPDLPSKAVVASIPYPSTAFWKLSALWSGWLFGKESISIFMGVIRRKRFDWRWHATALSETMKNLAVVLNGKTPFWLAINPIREGLIFAIYFALYSTKFSIRNTIFSPSPVNIILQGNNAEIKDVQIQKTKVSEIIKRNLNEYGQPVYFSRLLPGILTSLSVINHAVLTVESDNQFQHYRNQVKDSFKYREGLLHYGGSGDDVVSGLWGVSGTTNFIESEDDKVEKWLIRLLLINENKDSAFYVDKMWLDFPNSNNLSEEYLAKLLNSYGEKNYNSEWNLKQNEKTLRRQSNIKEIREAFRQIALDSSFEIEGMNPIIWRGERPKNYFYFGASAILSEKINSQSDLKGTNYVVIPASRAELILYKFERNPQLAADFAKNWKIVKFRTIRNMGKMGKVTPTQFEELVDSDSIENNDPQMRLI